MARPRHVKTEFVNSGSAAAKTDLLEGREHKLEYCRVLSSWKYIVTPQFTGVVPEKPTIVLKKDIRVKKDTEAVSLRQVDRRRADHGNDTQTH